MTMRPKVMVLFTSYRCNARCVMCYAWRKQSSTPELSAQDVARIFSDKILKNSIEIINLTGGEPTLRDDLIEIVDSLVDNCRRLKRIDISTNGINTSQAVDKVERVLARLLQTDIKLSVSVSVDGVGDVHDNVRGIKGAFKNIDNTLDELKELLTLYPTFSLGMNFTVNNKNYGHLYDAYAYSRKKMLGMNFTLAALSEIGVESMQVKNDFELPPEAKKKTIEFIKFLSREKGLNPLYEQFLLHWLKTGKRRGPCAFRKGLSVLCEPEGNAYACGNFRGLFIGNILKKPFSTLAIPKIRFWQQYKNKCRHCNSNCYIEST